MNEASLPWPAIASALFALISAIAATVSYRVHRTNLAAKFMDRLYELDKLILANADPYRAFVYARSWDDLPHSPTDDNAATLRLKVKAFAYYYVNLFDEIFAAYGTRHNDLQPSPTWHAWRNFILARARHPLLSALIETECVVGENRRLRPKHSSVFNPALLDFLCDSQEEWRGQPADLEGF